MNSQQRLDRWDPFKEIDDLQKRLRSFFGRTPIQNQRMAENEAMTASEWAPLVDISEDENEYLMKVEAPEVKKEDLNITVENGVLTISGARRMEKENGKRYHRIERSYGAFARTFTLPDNAEPAQVQAEFKEGILIVRVPKNEKARPKTVEVKIS